LLVRLLTSQNNFSEIRQQLLEIIEIIEVRLGYTNCIFVSEIEIRSAFKVH